MPHIDGRKVVSAAKLAKMVFVEKVKKVKLYSKYENYENYDLFVSGVELFWVIYDTSVIYPVKMSVD
jgi:hypothetical protein